MKIKTFDNIDQIHQIWNDSTWIRYNTILNEMGMIDLTPEQEEALFPEVPDYFIVDGKIYKPTIADHVEYYGRRIDECSFFRITLQETTDSDIINEVNAQLRKEEREELKQNTEVWLEELMKTHPWIKENRLVLRVGYEDGQIDNACLTMGNNVLVVINKERPNESDVEDWLNRLADYKTFIKWVIDQSRWSIDENSWLPDDIENIRIHGPIKLSETNTGCRVVIYVDTVSKKYKMTLTKRRNSDYIEAAIEFPVSEELVVSLWPSTQVKCCKGSVLSEQFSAPDTAQLGYILKYGINRVRTAVHTANENCKTERLKEIAERND